MFTLECRACGHRSFLHAHEVRQRHKAFWKSGGRVEGLKWRCGACGSPRVTALTYRPAYIDSVPRDRKAYGPGWPFPSGSVH